MNKPHIQREGEIRLADDLTGAHAYLSRITRNDGRGSFVLMAYVPKAKSRALIHCLYRTEAHRMDDLINFFWNLRERENGNLARRAARKEYQPLEPGDILAYSWGYEQTNVVFLKVVEVKGTNAMVVEIGATVKETWMGDSGTVVPNPEVVLGEPFKRKMMGLGAGRKPILTFPYGSAKVWDGIPRYFSSGH